jgi:hypothetical protein
VKLALFLLCVVLAGCRTAGILAGGALGGQPTALPAPPSPGLASAQNPKLMLFGGSGHKVYLGCLNCSEYATDSVENAYGTHGSPYAADSIFNHFGPYGDPFSLTSACNSLASDPPVIVDGAGAYYGRLTLNEFHPEIGTGVKLLPWLKKACE